MGTRVLIGEEVGRVARVSSSTGQRGRQEGEEMIAADTEGIWSGNLKFADIMFLIAFLLSIGAAVVAWAIQPRVLWATVISLALAAGFLGWMVL
jgi:hypothetical protein